ncbi:MAG: ABC transporter permease [Kiritimatiellae bacterium]|nr:ABC transporter permease [Kiritimatiellia bacterium]MDW8457917.1 ABC transporter permease [Verrucomicrobiota bacterium]
MSGLAELLKRRELLANLTARELKLRYRGSALGVFWSLLIPLFMALIYVVFLRLLGGRGVPLADVIIGVFAWQFTVQCVNSGLTSITGNANLVKKVAFPRLILPVSSTLANAASYLIGLAVQIPLVAILSHIDGKTFDAAVVFWPAVFGIHLLFNLSLAFLLSALNVYMRDIQHLVGLALSAWFFVSPVMYNLDLVLRHAGEHPWIPQLFMLNPMAVILTGYRACLFGGVDFPWSLSSSASLLLVLLLFAVSYRAFQKLQKDFADLL